MMIGVWVITTGVEVDCCGILETVDVETCET